MGRSTRAFSSGVALAAYVAIAVADFGWPLVHHPGRDYVGYGEDPQIFIWLFAWWPHAILHGENPLYTHAVWAPAGESLSWVTSVPGLAIAMAPLTLVAGPVVSYNVAAVLLPALAAWTAFLLCRYLTGSQWAALAGGYLFGFSAYELGHEQGHPNLSCVFLVPLVVLLVLRHLDGAIGRLRLSLWLGALLGLQAWISTEVLVTLTLALAIGLVAAFCSVPRLRMRLRRLALPLLGAYALGAAIAGPLLVEMLRHFNGTSLNSPYEYSADLMNVAVPTSLAAVKNGWTETASAAFRGNTAENGAYLGLPILAILVWFAWSRRTSREARLLVLLLLLGVLAELGPRLELRGVTYYVLPWRALVNLPVFNDVLPARIAMYVALAAAVVVALWIADAGRNGVVRIVLPLLAVATLVPAFWQGSWHTHPGRPAFVATGLYRTAIARGETVLVLPYPSYDDAMLWQAETGFWYRMADGSLSPAIPDGVADRPFASYLLSNDAPPGGRRAVLAFAKAHGVAAIVIENVAADPWIGLFPSLAERGTAGGVFLYRLPEPPR